MNRKGGGFWVIGAISALLVWHSLDERVSDAQSAADEANSAATDGDLSRAVEQAQETAERAERRADEAAYKAEEATNRIDSMRRSPTYSYGW